MKKQVSATIPTSMIEALKGVPLSRSAAISQAIVNAGREPDLLVHAFRLRLSQPKEDDDHRVTYSRDERLDEIVKNLSDLTKLPGEQVIRLCVEAYIHRL